MKVAPFHACLACYRGDTGTVVNVDGEAEFIIAIISRITDMSIEEAEAVFVSMARQDLGAPRGLVPGGRVTVGIRLCRECATKNGVPAAALVTTRGVHEGDPTLGFIQPADEDDR